ncbi:MAG: helix-turn-helix domain-containing protein [Planctomycetes bacterium]|nr:helix-turn-helix domain-containing protein [Planctomycetota bacterium]
MDALVGCAVSDVFPVLTGEVEPVLLRVLAGDGPVLDHEVTFERDPGEPPRHWRLHYHPVPDEAGVSAVIVVAEDVTEQRRSEQDDRFLAEIGETPADWTRQQRIASAKRRLAESDTPITALALDLGFPSSQYFATVFRRYAGLTPREFRRRASTKGDDRPHAAGPRGTDPLRQRRR